MWVIQAKTFQVWMPDGKYHYTQATSPEKAVANVAHKMSDQLKTDETPTNMYMKDMIEELKNKTIPWPDEYPQLEHPMAVEIMKQIESVLPAGKINMAKLEQLESMHRIPSSDVQSIRWFIKSISEPKPQKLPEQLELDINAFYKESNKEHPAAQLADYWKTTHKLKFVNIEDLQNIMLDDQAIITPKLDGELVAIWYDKGSAEVVTYKGTIRSNFPAIKEVAELVKKAGYKQATFMGELYAVDTAGKPISYMKSASILRDPVSGKDDQLRIGIYDIIFVDDTEYIDINIMEKLKAIDTLFKPGKLVHPIPYVQGGMTQIESMWDKLDQQGWEGLVIYDGTMIYKVKPVMSYDMVVVAIEKSPRFIDRIGAALCSFIDKDSRFRLNGFISGGFTDQEKVELYDWALRNKVSEDEDRIWVDPFKEPIIVEVEAMEVNIKDRPKLEFEDGKWTIIEEDMSGVLRFPHINRIREDKEPTHRDVPLEQLPIESAEMQYLNIGNHVEVITGQQGKIIGIVPNSGSSGWDFDIIIDWDIPLWGEIKISEVHPSEVVKTWKA